METERPDSSGDSDSSHAFSSLRAHLLAVGYRLTGSLADAEDAVQETWLRWAGLPDARREAVRDLRAWCTTVVGRVCLDRLRSAAARRERYVGQWLPEPIVTPLGTARPDDPLDVVVRDDAVRMAAMVVLDTLTPQQRVAFVLHDAFDVPFDEIADILDCSVAAARQHASRGRRAVADAEPPPRESLEHQRLVVERFLAAVSSGDVRAVAEVLHPDARFVGDSDGKARTALRVLVGVDKIARFAVGLVATYRPGALMAARPVLVNGDLGFHLAAEPGEGRYRDLHERVHTMAVRDGRIVAIYDIANPDKLTRIPR
ncbi:sigma-70 family RNA polymerase sigma factor [Saccharomonospora cyanea]|uniref:RNA polymerase sigma factor, sigma-70 family n=1 Tax=Saccharomonospora cyanea NA-134 TaxID=882082 RepID=H5XGJ1_9PSEU|nr:sigma-70 family RNA polymerase sigma factor [Saccharomonospora cyanea]EHR60530.1 RNA polymerase sigma factor, sigma-70 family [Saccharomonospora cyanea NA-134]